MPMRVTGMYSGLDTESIIQELVAARRVKVDSATKAQTKLGWKQEAWKDLNTKLKNLQTKYLSNMRFTSDYAKKTTKVSNSSVVSVITGENAVNGVQSLQVDRLAKTGYLTGAEISKKNGGKLTALSKLSDVMDIEGEGKINLKAGNKSVDIKVTGDTTISDVLNQIKKAGLNASFDAQNQRFFVSSPESGKANDFTFTAADENGAAALSALGLSVESGATKTDGEDALIRLNGAEFTSSNNVFEINGLTFNVLSETKAGESVTVTTQNDTEGVYDMIKNFLKEYNAVINEMDRLYNAESAKDYEPLTDEEKEAMTESEIEKWEQKIKDSILRRDSSVSSVSSALKEIMAGGITVNGKTMHLYDFGISTLGYFEAEDNERNAYHIDGDADDASVSGKADKLASMLANDPDTVISFFTQLSQQLYTKMSDMSSSVNGYRSFGSFYDDKKMQSDYDDYTSKISKLEEQLTAYEDKWYAKFSAMETALAKMQSNASAITSLLGVGG